MSNKVLFYLAAAFTLLTIANAGANVVRCEYDANEEWPWTVEKTCQTRTPAIAAALLANDAATGNWPACLSANSDPDGDGWGWENRSSCRVLSVLAPGQTPCASGASDPDGDGWGWENNQSCIVKADLADPARAPANVATHPQCTTSAVDPDGDGYGWENNQSCIVKTDVGTDIAYPQCSSAAVDPDGDGWGYENNKSCQVGETAQHPQCSSASVDEDGDGWGYENYKSCKFSVGTDGGSPTEEESDFKVGTGVVLQQNFDAAPTGQYTPKHLNRDWNTPLWHMGFAQGRAHILQEQGHGNILRITYPANTFGPQGASAFLSDLSFAAELPASYDALYISYDIKFANGFDFVRGGKLPGLCGYNKTQSPSTGCNTGGGYPNGFDGWSARGMWRVDGSLENYVYHSAQRSYYGDDEHWRVKAVPGQWHSVQHHVVLNTVGQADGKLEAWFDGRKVLQNNALTYRKTGNIGINLFYFSTFFGGNDPTWAPSVNQYIYFDNFRIATTPLGSSSGSGSGTLTDDAVSDNTIAAATAYNPKPSGGGALSWSFILLLLFRRTAKLWRKIYG